MSRTSHIPQRVAAEDADNVENGIQADNVEDGIHPEDSASQVGQSVLSSSISARRSELSVKRAAILREAAVDKEQFELEMQQHKLRQKMQELDMKRRLAAVQAEEQMLAARAQVDSDPDPEITFKNLDPTVKEFIPNSSEDVPVVSLLKQGQMQNAQLIEAIRLPTAQLTYFNGDPISYWPFIRAFENCVANSVVDDGAKLMRLVHYCTGPARRVVESCMIMPPTTGYARALELLKERFGNNFMILQAWIQRITAGAPIKNNDRFQLQQFADDLACCRETLTAMNSQHEMNNQATLLKIIERLPSYLQSRWKREVGLIRKSRNPQINDVVSFVAHAATEANDPVYGHLNCGGRSELMKQKHSASTFKSTSFATSCSEGDRSNGGKSCILCSDRHPLYRCSEFIKMQLDERLKYANEKKLCYNCLSVGHVSTKCKSSYTCQVPGCNKKHSKYLHRVKPPMESDGDGNSQLRSVQSAAQCTCTGAGVKTRVALPIVPVVVSTDQHDVVVSTYALLDSGSTNSFCSAELVNQLHVTGNKSLISLTTLDQANCVTEVQSVSLQITGVTSGASVKLPVVYVRPQMSISGLDTVKSTNLTQWPHLSEITFPDVDLNQVTLLIGQDSPEALMPLEIRRAEVGNAPYATRTVLGWTLNGPIGTQQKTDQASVNFISADTRLEQQVRQFWEMEGGDLNVGEMGMSVNDKRVIDLWSKSARVVDGHYELPIPFKDLPPVLPNNRVVAEKRLQHLKSQLAKDQCENYKLGMEDLIDKGYAVKVPDEEIQQEDKAVWYLPHHRVSNQHKPDKIRIVFDCAAKFRHSSLNDHVLQGPDLTNKLIGVLLRFRQDPVALMADIEAMFHQVRVVPQDQDVLRFLWWPRGDKSCEPEEYRMTVHLFGGVWSPSCANYALRRTAEDNTAYYDEEVVKCVYRNFYVDDFLKSVQDERVAVQLVRDLTQLLAQGGFHLTKWICNSREVMKTIDETHRAKAVKGLDLSHEKLPTERALGTVWEVESDTFEFRTVTKDKPPTRRGILSILSSVFDPLGLLSPGILSAKVIVQELWRRNIGWDEDIPTDLMMQWTSWLKLLSKVELLKVERCVKPLRFDSEEVTLHHFADASQVAYGVASYLRTRDAKGNISCSLLMAKSRLAPIKSVTIPRLELSAAALAVKLDKLIRAELDIELSDSVFWTDSTIVLAYIKNPDLRFQTFVANRVSVIQEGSSPSQWRHVRSEMNPADDVSRGLSFDELINNRRWFQGPNFLMGSEESWPVLTEAATDMSRLEVKANVNTCASVNDEVSDSPIDRLFTRYSSFYKLKKCVGWILRLKNILRSKVSRQNVRQTTASQTSELALTVHEIQQSEEAIIRYVQNQAFGNLTQEGKYTNTNNSLRKLNPILSDRGVLCVGGRLDRADISDNTKHQVILPRKHPVVSLIVRESHENTNHGGKEFTLAKLRERYWIISARAVVRNELQNCFTCRRSTARPGIQKMSDLPVERVTPGKPAFAYVGLDYFGPFLVKQGRSSVKRYGCIFTCLTSRAIHIEIAHSLDTDSFINALQRFICRRGRPEVIRSDNGTNFIGAERELREALKNWNERKIEEYLRQKEICWKFNTPAASHMGGVWERMIRSVRKVLTGIVKEQTLSDEVLTTVMCEAEATVNSRPITPVSDDPSDLNPLTPNHILLLRTSTSMPVGEFEQRETYRRRWKQAQYLSNIFWRRWIREYLPTLQYRHRWIEPKRNFRIGDMVIVVDDSVPRNSWPLGRVTAVFPGDDGLVRTVRVKTMTSSFTRPITKICLLEATE